MSKIGVSNRSRALCRLALLLMTAAPTFSHAEARFQFAVEDLTITLHDDTCAFKSEITNLPRRVMWKNNKETVEGCWGFSSQFGLILLWFSDKTSTALPAPLFKPLINT